MLGIEKFTAEIDIFDEFNLNKILFDYYYFDKSELKRLFKAYISCQSDYKNCITRGRTTFYNDTDDESESDHEYETMFENGEIEDTYDDEKSDDEYRANFD